MVSTSEPAPAVVIAAPASGTGKTTIATGIMAALARRMEVAPFKVGPDYIDPGYHTLAAGRIGRNLDSVMCGRDRIGPLYAHGAAGTDIAVVEGVMGLYDGRIGGDPLDAEGSTAEIARLLGAPVILVVDARHMSQSAAALVHGFATIDDRVRIAGAIINHVGSPRHAEIATQAVEAVGVPVLGAIPRVDDIEVPSRHLGLITAVESGQRAHDVVQTMADLVEKHVNLDELVRLASLSWTGAPWDPAAEVGSTHSPGTKIAIAGGPAFTFAYAEHRELLEAAGAQVEVFDPLSDDLPHCDGLVIPGGFPEEHAAELAAREDLSRDLKKAVDGGLSVHGECAGLLWLLDSVDGHRMCGVIPAKATMDRRLTLGYRSATALGDSVVAQPGQRVTGHEFHRTGLVGDSQQARESGWAPVWGWRDWLGAPVTEGFASPDGRVHASYLHVHPAGSPGSVSRFVQACF